MKQVYLHFKECKLGFLTEDAGVFVWVPNPQGIADFVLNYEAASDLLFLSLTEPQAFKNIPYHFDEFVESSNRADLAKKANISSLDSDFEKLCKMATLDYFNEDFYVSI